MVEKPKKETKHSEDSEQAKGQKTEGASPIVTRKFDDLVNVPDFVTFLQMKALAGEYSTNAALSDDQKAAIVAEYGRWIKAGSPRPSMPNLTGIAVPVITSIYRLKVRGKQKIYAYMSDGSTKGLSKIEKKVRRVDPNTGKEFETNELSGEVEKQYTLDYTKEIGEHLLESALATADNSDKVGLYIYEGKQKLGPVSPEEFNLDWDSLVSRYKPKK
jgi:hypothetical protein